MKIFNQLFIIVLLLSTFTVAENTNTILPHYYCTAADAEYFDRLLNLIGCLHKHNFDQLGELMVVDLGLNQEQKVQLNKIQKLRIHQLQPTNPYVYTKFNAAHWGKMAAGWYSWKPISLKEALDIYPYVLWIDAGTTVLKPLDNLFKHIVQNDYFLMDLGGPEEDVSLGWGATRYVRDMLELETPENQWLLRECIILSGLLGATKKAPFLEPFYKMSYNIKFFEDDGSAPSGFGGGRHDQTLITYLAYSMHLQRSHQVGHQKSPSWLLVDGKQTPFYVTWRGDWVTDDTCIYNSRNDMSQYQHFVSCIRYK